MPEESPTPDLEEQARQLVEARERRDYDAMLAMFAPDAVRERTQGLGTYKGRDAIRGVIDEWVGAFADFNGELEEFRALGGGVTLGVLFERGRPKGGSAFVERRYGVVATWTDGLITRITNYLEIDDARAAAERLAEERG